MHTATFNLHDNKLKLYLDQSDRIPRDEFDALRKSGLAWWRGSKCFAGVWTPECEDAVLKYVEEVEYVVDDDTGLAYRLERFERYADNAGARAAGEQARIDRIGEGIPLGQPILVGHHSERHARRDQKLLDAAMRRKIWDEEKAGYWAERQKRAEKHAAYKERPDVIRRRIERYEADLRRWQREVSEKERLLWVVSNPSGNWDAHVRYSQRWIDHLEMVLDYQRELYARSGGVPFDRGEVTLEVGGAIKNRYPAHWVPIIKVNPKSVTVPDTYHWDALLQGDGKGVSAFTRTVEKAEIRRALTKAEYEQHEDYAFGQRLLAAMEAEARSGPQVEKGGAVKTRYFTGGGESDWMHVLRVNRLSLTVLKWTGQKWWKTQVEKRDVSGVMPAIDWAKHVEQQKHEVGDGRWENLLQQVTR